MAVRLRRRREGERSGIEIGLLVSCAASSGSRQKLREIVTQSTSRVGNMSKRQDSMAMEMTER